MPLGLNATDLSAITIISLAFGLYFGLGMPATMAYHSSFTEISGRAALGGFTFLIIGATFAVVGSLVSYGLTVICLLLLAIRLIGLFVFHSMPQKQEPIKDPVKVQYRGIITQKSFLSYFIPWLMFALINYMTYPVVDRAIGDNFTFLSIAESIIIAVVAVLTGLIADKWGRKRLIIIGFVMIGIGYAVLGLDSHQISVGIYTIGDFGRVVYSIADGIAWGIFFVLFLVTIWGDLAQGRSSDKFYFLGAVPYVSSFFMQFALENALSQISPVTIFSFASVFLFLSVLPLIYAVETLPEKVMKDRDLKSYIENAKKKAAKMTQKKMQSPQEEADEPSENSADYEEAKKLAEKYY
jgi:hypothetical protein